ncbi:MAG: hypothetical protein C3F12_05575 [Candidatus Methylomirabilota bacterium]|nr:hypothetical protein [Candidatus Methylomirabilis sp.]NJD67290.1 hypothetical protein [candidate division NC10 bacterium]PWB47439.1 MAG: hypothetical protein C3F12_05575 [candidate division NC10 bacterium]
MKTNRFVRRTLAALSALGLAAALSPLSPAWANGNEATDLVAPYGHFDMAAGTAPGPLTTHYLISNTADFLGIGGSVTVNVKCFNDGIQRVGPAAGTDITVGAFEMAVHSPLSLGLTSDLDYTGLGFCYFAATGGDIAVSFLVGVSDGNNLITSNNAVAIMSDTAQSQVIESPGGFPIPDVSDANIPYWTEEGRWQTFVLALNPTATDTNLDMDVYRSDGFLLGSWLGILNPPGLDPRDLDFTRIADAVPGAAGLFGHADIHSADRGFMGWIVGMNFNTFQAFMYQIPLQGGDVSPLAAGDRP